MCKEIFLLLGQAFFLTITFFIAISQAALSREIRVVALVPSLAEILEELSVKNSANIVGVPEFTDRPPSLLAAIKRGEIKSIGPYHKPNLEIILSLKPDLILASEDGTPKTTVEQLVSAGKKVSLFKANSLLDVKNSYEEIAKLLPLSQRLSSIQKDFRVLEEQIKKNALTCQIPIMAVFFDPGGSSLVAVGGENYINELFVLMGFENHFGATSKNKQGRYPRPSKEEILKAKEKLLIVLATENESNSQLMSFIATLGWQGEWIGVKETGIQRPTIGSFRAGLTLQKEAQSRICKRTAVIVKGSK